MEFEWDDEKRQSNFEKHGVDLLDAALIFEGPVITSVDRRTEYGEDRFVSMGVADGVFYVLVHTPRGAKTRLISAWRGGRRQYGKYQKSIARRNQKDEGAR